MLSMSHFDALEEAGHDLTHCGMIWAGTHLYYCENCGAVTLHGLDQLMFHAPKHSRSTQGRCVAVEAGCQLILHHTLKSKLEKAQEADRVKLRSV